VPLTVVGAKNHASAGASTRDSPAFLNPAVSSTIPGYGFQNAPSYVSQTSVTSPVAGVVMAIAKPRKGSTNPT
jgi:hypothetical protein